MIILRELFIKAYWWAHFKTRWLLGSVIDENRFRHRAPADVRLGFSNLTLPHREWFANKITRDLEVNQGYPLHFVEVGCGWGPNLAVLARRGLGLRLTGVDISPASILEGRKQLMELGLSEITLVEMQGDDLSLFADASADVVFTDAMLLYVGPDKIKRVVQELLRIARNRLVMLEMHDQGATYQGHCTRDGWLRNYVALLGPLVGKDAVQLEKLPPGLRTAGRWPKYGSLIEVDLTKKGKDIA
jgi:ubiquinone/menaquinone biosynthesis C-methylase UbiE